MKIEFFQISHCLVRALKLTRTRIGLLEYPKFIRSKVDTTRKEHRKACNFKLNIGF